MEMNDIRDSASIVTTMLLADTPQSLDLLRMCMMIFGSTRLCSWTIGMGSPESIRGIMAGYGWRFLEATCVILA